MVFATLAGVAALAGGRLGEYNQFANAIAEHNLKRHFATPSGPVDFDCSPSYARGASMAELLGLHPPAQAELLGLSLSSYTEDLGRGTRLAAAVAALYDDSVTPEDVLILSGVDPVIHDTFAALIEPGMRVALQSPAYPPLRNVPAWRGAEIVAWEPTSPYGGWDVAATENADVVVATLPHSPFGWAPEEEWLRSLAASAEARGQLLVVDEIYRGLDLTSDGSGVLPSACELCERAIVFGGLAKTYGLTGLRVGWLVCRDEGTGVIVASNAWIAIWSAVFRFLRMAPVFGNL